MNWTWFDFGSFVIGYFVCYLVGSFVHPCFQRMYRKARKKRMKIQSEDFWGGNKR